MVEGSEVELTGTLAERDSFVWQIMIMNLGCSLILYETIVTKTCDLKPATARVISPKSTIG